MTQLAGPAPSCELGDSDGNVPLYAIERYGWLFETAYYQALLKQANLASPTPLSRSGNRIEINYACINRTLPSCRLVEDYWAPNLEERTNGQLRLVVTALAETSLSGNDILRLVSDGTLDMANVYGGYISGELPVFDVQSLWGLYPDHRTAFGRPQRRCPFWMQF